jgi:hypothetical protein
MPFLVLSSFTIAMQIKDLAQAVDVAGKQRMFTQRMLKDYAMVGLENKFGNPDEDLKKIMGHFEDHLNALIDFNKDAATNESLLKVKELWNTTKVALEKVPSKENAGKMQEDLEILLKQANDATQLFAKQTRKASGEIINISGRQRMLSQRMASLYMLKVWGVNDAQFQDKMNKALALFKNSQAKLMASKMNTKEITTLLQKSKKSFMFFEMMNKSKSKFIPTLIYKKSNDILRDMNIVTGLYVIEENK